MLKGDPLSSLASNALRFSIGSLKLKQIECATPVALKQTGKSRRKLTGVLRADDFTLALDD